MKIDISLERIKKHKPLSNKYLQYRLEWQTVPQTYVVTQVPINLDIELTSKCNLECHMCAFHGAQARFGMKDEFMSFRLFKKIIDEFAAKGGKAIKLNYSGEPLLHPHIFPMIKYAKKKGIIEVMFNTNGTLLYPETARELIEAGLDKIIFSDYGKRDVYEKIVELAVMKQLKGSRTPLIRVQKLLYPETTREAVTEHLTKVYGEIADELGVQLFFEYNKPQKDKKSSDFQCAYPWQRMLILADGRVLTCCGMPDKSKHIGNAWSSSIEELWHHEYYDFIREKTRNKETHLIKGCQICPMRVKVLEEVP